MKKALIPGSFDPVTLGHLDIITRASKIFDEVHVGVLTNIEKSPAFSLDERKEMLRRVTKHLDNVVVDSFSGLLVHYLMEKEINIVVKGVRSSIDFEYELQMHAMNKMLDEKVETLFLPAEPELGAVSSSAVREIASFGGRLDTLVPEEIIVDIRRKFSK